MYLHEYRPICRRLLHVYFRWLSRSSRRRPTMQQAWTASHHAPHIHLLHHRSCLRKRCSQYRSTSIWESPFWTRIRRSSCRRTNLHLGGCTAKREGLIWGFDADNGQRGDRHCSALGILSKQRRSVADHFGSRWRHWSLSITGVVTGSGKSEMAG